MEYLSKKLRSITSLFSTQIIVESSPSRTRHNIYLENIFRLLSWNDPCLTWSSFLALNFLFWLVAQYELKLIGVLFFIILVLFLYENLFRNIGNTGAELNSSHEMEQCVCVVNLVFSTIIILRKENPSAFCLAMSVFFLILSFIARNISGILLTYLVLLGLFFLPIGYQKLPLQVKHWIKKSMNSLLTSQDVINEDDLIPYHIRFKCDDKDDLESLNTEHTAESVSNSLISGISSMPSFIDAEDDDEILEEDLIPITQSLNQKTTSTFADLSSDSDSDIRELRFKESHFTRDSSSDEGSKFEEGLQFSEDTSDSTTAQHGGTNRLVQNLMDYVASASSARLQLPGIISSAISSMQVTNVIQKDSSSESDFEVINSEDVKQ